MTDFPLSPKQEPADRTMLQEMVEGRQLAFLDVHVGGLPEGWPGIALEFTSAEVMIIAAARNLTVGTRFGYVLCHWYIEAPVSIWKSRATYLRTGPQNVPMLDVQKKTQGLVVRGVWVLPDPNAAGGEEVHLEFTTGDILRLRALPDDLDDLLATLDAEFVDKRERVHSVAAALGRPRA